jgi:hypothetical protein
MQDALKSTAEKPEPKTMQMQMQNTLPKTGHEGGRKQEKYRWPFEPNRSVDTITQENDGVQQSKLLLC